MSDRLFTHMFRSLVDQVGGVDAAAAAIEASSGRPVSRGTVSKIQNGNAEVPLAWAYALEDETGNACFTRLRIRKLEGQEDVVGAAMVTHIHLVKESSEAVIALAAAESSQDPDQLAASKKELMDVIEVAEECARIIDSSLARIGLEASE